MKPDQFEDTLDELGFTKAGFARLCGVTDRQVYNWCNGTSEVPVLVVFTLKAIQASDLVKHMAKKAAFKRRAKPKAYTRPDKRKKA